MTGKELKKYRERASLTQERAAKLLGVSQTYLSLIESNKRSLTQKLKQKVVKKFNVPPTELPAAVSKNKVTKISDDQLTADLSALGYPGFSHYKPSRAKNPADVLLSALNADKRDARLVEALPWVVLRFGEMDWNAVVRTAKLYDLQNRLGFVVNVARRTAKAGNDATVTKLRAREAELERSMLAREDTLCNETMTKAERKWLATERPPEAKHWHLFTGLSPHQLRYFDEE